jgi:alkanesulfonate monooxygenase SsuD/methylene tetrahydromethanopterin reductase-like flavin-dependent oxidoreductase (luciferase family)
MVPKKQIHINCFETACTGSHMGIGQWKGGEADNSRKKDSLKYYTWLARLADKGKITSIFFADTYAVMDTYEGCGDASFRGGYGVAQLDPVVFVSAMAEVSRNVSFGITGSTSYIPVCRFHPVLNCHVIWC